MSTLERGGNNRSCQKRCRKSKKEKLQHGGLAGRWQIWIFPIVDLQVFHCMDLHCGGEPARVLLSGCPPVKGLTVQEKRRWELRQKLTVERFQADSNLIFRWFLIGDNSARSDWNLPERDALTPPGESLVTILCICAGFHVLVLTSYFLAAVTILSLERNKKLLTSLSAKRHNAITCWSEGSKFTQ